MDWIVLASRSGMTLQEMRDLFEAETGISFKHPSWNTEEDCRKMAQFKEWIILNI